MAARLLLADDSVTIQRVIELTFAEEDVDVIAVGDGEAAIARLDTDPPDIVLADVGMPGRDGYAVAAHVKATPALAHIPVLLLAGAFEPVDERRVAEAGCAGVLVKPFEPQMVISRVRSLLAERRTRPTLAAADPSRTEPAVHAPVAVPAPPPSSGDQSAARAPQARRQSVDDYFEQLDAAFATLNAQLDEAPSAVSASMPAAVPPAADAGPAPPTPRAPVAPPSESPAGVPLSMADAFDALLGVEQGAPPPVLPDAWMPVLTDDLVDRVARRIAEQVGDRIVREFVPGIVTGIAERLVREEIARIRSEAEGATDSERH